MARVMGTLRDIELITQFTMRLRRQFKMDITPLWNGFKILRFAESHSSRLDGAKHSAHTTTRFQKKIIHTCALQKGIKDVKTVGYWYSTSKVTTVR